MRTNKEQLAKHSVHPGVYEYVMDLERTKNLWKEEYLKMADLMRLHRAGAEVNLEALTKVVNKKEKADKLALKNWKRLKKTQYKLKQVTEDRDLLRNSVVIDHWSDLKEFYREGMYKYMDPDFRFKVSDEDFQALYAAWHKRSNKDYLEAWGELDRFILAYFGEMWADSVKSKINVQKKGEEKK